MRWFSLLLAAFAILAICAGYQAMPVTVSQIATWISLSVLPGVSLLFLVRRRVTLVELCCFGTGLGAPVGGGVTLLLYRAGLNLTLASQVTIALCTILLLVRTLSPGKNRLQVESSGEDLPLFLFSALVLVSISILPLSSYWWRVRSDAWFHGAVTFEILRAGAPPLDPYFAGMNLNYMWFFHFYLAMLDRLGRIDPFWSMFLLNVQYLLCLLTVVYALSRGMGATWRAALLSAAVAVLGLNGFFWLFWPLKAVFALTGQVRGIEELRRVIGVGIFGVNEVREQLSVLGSIPFFLDKYMVGTAFSLALSLFMLSLFGILKSFSEKGVANATLAAASLVGVALLHVVVLMAAAAAIVGASILTMIFPTPSRGTAWALAKSAVLPLVVSLVLCAAYLASVMGSVEGSGTGTRAIHPTIWSLSSVVVSCAGVLLLALRPMLRAFRERSVGDMFLMWWILSLLGVAVCVKLPLDNQTKFTFTLHLSLACVAGTSFYWLLDRMRTSARKNGLRLLLLLFLLPVNLIAFVGYATSPQECPPGKTSMELYTWISSATELNAVFLEESELLDIPVLAKRDLYFGKESHARGWGYDPREIEARRAVRKEFFSAEPVSQAAMESVESLGRPFYVVLRASHPSYRELFKKLAEDPALEKVFSNEIGSLFRVRPGVGDP